MKNIRTVLFGFGLLGAGFAVGWYSKLRFMPDSVHPPEYGVAGDCVINTEVIWHPETGLEMGDRTFHTTTWRWVLRNISTQPMKLSLPKQSLHIDHGIGSSEYVDIPESLVIDPPITLAPGERHEISAKSGGTSWHKAKNGEYAFQIIAQINDRFHILNCSISVSQAPKGK